MNDTGKRLASWRVSFYDNRKCAGDESTSFYSNAGEQGLLPLPGFPQKMPQSVRWDSANGMNLFLYYSLDENEPSIAQPSGCTDLLQFAVPFLPLGFGATALRFIGFAVKH